MYVLIISPVSGSMTVAGSPAQSTSTCSPGLRLICMVAQMYWGLQYQRYDTYINYLNDLSHPLPQVYFMDPVGNRILEAMKVDSFSSWNEYFNIFIHYPIDVLEIYLRYFVNFLFPCWPKLYIENLNSSKWLLGIGRIINYISWRALHGI